MSETPEERAAACVAACKDVPTDILREGLLMEVIQVAAKVDEGRARCREGIKKQAANCAGLLRELPAFVALTKGKVGTPDPQKGTPP